MKQMIVAAASVELEESNFEATRLSLTSLLPKGRSHQHSSSNLRAFFKADAAYEQVLIESLRLFFRIMNDTSRVDCDGYLMPLIKGNGSAEFKGIVLSLVPLSYMDDQVFRSLYYQCLRQQEGLSLTELLTALRNAHSEFLDLTSAGLHDLMTITMDNAKASTYSSVKNNLSAFERQLIEYAVHYAVSFNSENSEIIEPKMRFYFKENLSKEHFYCSLYRWVSRAPTKLEFENRLACIEAAIRESTKDVVLENNTDSQGSGL